MAQIPLVLVYHKPLTISQSFGSRGDGHRLTRSLDSPCMSFDISSQGGVDTTELPRSGTNAWIQ